MNDSFLNNSFFRPDFLVTDNIVRLELNEQCDINVNTLSNVYRLSFNPKFYTENQIKTIVDKIYYFSRPYINKETVSPKLVIIERKDNDSVKGYINQVTIQTSTEYGTLSIEFSILIS